MWSNLLDWCMRVLLICQLPGGVAVAAELLPLQDLVAQRRCDVFVEVSARQRQAAQAGFANLLKSSSVIDESVELAWAELGFTLFRLETGGERWIVLRESAAQCRGQGIYLVRRDSAAALLLQIPHGYFDKYTDDIAVKMLQMPMRAAAFNTVPRHYRSDIRKIDADLAHRDHTIFNAFTQAFADAYPQGRLIQLHGFSAAKRKTMAGQSAVAIVSAGTRLPTSSSVAVATCLASLLDDPVRLYPLEVEELGATTNIQGQLLRGRGHNGFVHVETSLALRERLRREAPVRAGFAACLSKGLEPQ